MARESSLPLRPPRMIQRTRTGHGTVPVVRRAWRSDATSERDPLNRLVPRPAAIGRAHHEGRRRPVACKPVRLWHPNPPDLKSIAKGDGMELFPISRIPRSGLGRTGCGASRGSGEVRTSAQEGATPQRQRIRCNRPDLLLATGWRCQRSPRNWPPPPLALTHPGAATRAAPALQTTGGREVQRGSGYRASSLTHRDRGASGWSDGVCPFEDANLSFSCLTEHGQCGLVLGAFVGGDCLAETLKLDNHGSPVHSSLRRCRRHTPDEEPSPAGLYCRPCQGGVLRMRRLVPDGSIPRNPVRTWHRCSAGGSVRPTSGVCVARRKCWALPLVRLRGR